MKNLSVSSEYEIVVAISGNHEAGKGDNDVQLLKIEQQNMTHLPKHLQKFFPNLEGLIIDSTNLKVISRQDLSAFLKLKFLFIGRNHIEKLDAGIFEDTPEIEWLVFIDNFTKRIFSEVLKPLSKLHFANFQRNTCINRKAVNLNEIDVLVEEIKRRC